jgi:hypothetical protein
MPPTICVHGYQSNQAVWLPLARYLEEHDYPGTVFAVTMPSEKKLNLIITKAPQNGTNPYTF